MALFTQVPGDAQNSTGYMVNDNSAPAAPTPVAPVDNSAIKLLVVEDEPAARDLFKVRLEQEGYEVWVAEDGKDAVAKAAAEKFNLILMDIVMPNMDGLEALKIIKSDKITYGDPIVVMLTNISGDIAVTKAMELGAAGFKLKIELEPDQLVEEVKAFLSGKHQDVQAEPVSRSLLDQNS